MFKYNMPTNIFFGKDCLKNNFSSNINKNDKPLIVTGKRSAIVSGAQTDILEILKSKKIDYKIFNKITENPKLKTVHKGAEYFLKNNCNMVIGIGGGSPIDSAKAISIIAANKLENREVYNFQKIKNAYPIIAIPTTSGTGTEATQYSVITDSNIDKKVGFGTSLIFPKFSFLDPQYTISLPKIITRDTAVDALSHLLEGLYSKKRSKIVYPIIFSGVKLIFENLKDTMNDLENIKLREKLMLASLWGGMVIAQTGSTMQHAIGYPITTKYGISHGLANGIVMKSVMEKYYPTVKEDLNELFDFLNIKKNDFYEWLISLDLTIGKKLDIEFIENNIETVLNTHNMENNPVKIDANDIRNIYNKIN
ncbi:MAG: iron-containing alcohol dehydrogenase [Candidatus Marinimicrobia bacterium]|nr:iron-containing alcohol dehydrogenase [Candidatus Neomarinimicrobiota bacterium]